MKEAELMLIGARLRQLREQKQLSQGDIEERAGLLRCYVSRVENGHTVPSLETLERFARVLDVPLYQLFISGKEVPPTPNLTPRKTLDELMRAVGDKGGDAQFLLKLRNLLIRLTERDRDVILSLAKRLAAR
jgi:transcriptional regulator with XRE-family HTH domain